MITTIIFKGENRDAVVSTATWELFEEMTGEGFIKYMEKPSLKRSKMLLYCALIIGGMDMKFEDFLSTIDADQEGLGKIIIFGTKAVKELEASGMYVLENLPKTKEIEDAIAEVKAKKK